MGSGPTKVWRFLRWLLGAAVGAGLVLGASDSPAESAGRRAPHLSPDYADVAIPPNLAPLNFALEEPDVQRHRVRLTSTYGNAIELSGPSNKVIIPLGSWRELLARNTNQPLFVDIEAQGANGQWRAFDRVTNSISADPIDGHLVYRLVRPVYNIYGPVGIYQRDLGTFEQRAVLENRRLERGCLNCHTFLNRRPEMMALHIRHKGAGNPMLLVRSNEVTRVDKTAGYLSWHPSGRLLAYSVNKFALLFHTAGETRDLYDSASDLGIYRVDSNIVVTPPPIAQPDRAETWPSWAPDGRHLYFCAAPKLRMERLKQIRYDLMRVAYDIDRDQWGEPEVVVSAQEMRASAAQPRISPDGRWLLFCLSPYGNFPAYSPGADLWMMDLKDRSMRRLEINSDVSDAWHSWSSNGRWVVFSSKRRDALFTRPHFSHMDEQGRFSKPFILPQQDPYFYDAMTFTYNVPEFIQAPVTVSAAELARGALHPRRVLRPATPSAQGTPAPPDDHEAEEGRSSEVKGAEGMQTPR